jgi:hypothetical protein
MPVGECAQKHIGPVEVVLGRMCLRLGGDMGRQRAEIGKT